MSYKYRVTLEGLKGFFRLYEFDINTTLYELHKQMRQDMEFPLDQLVLFKALDEKDKVVARYGLFDLGFGTIDAINFKQTLDQGIVKFIYFYDITNKKSVEITFEELDEEKKLSEIALIDTKGPNPIEFEHGYIAYEDLPEDQKHVHIPKASKEVEEDDDEEVEDNDTPEIYDEDEEAI